MASNIYSDIDFEEDFVVVPNHTPNDGWVMVEESDQIEQEQVWERMTEANAKSMREQAVKKKFSKELLTVATLTGKSVAELTATWADHLVLQMKQSGKKVTAASQALHERIYTVIHKKAEPELILNPNAYRDEGPCFPPPR